MAGGGVFIRLRSSLERVTVVFDVVAREVENVIYLQQNVLQLLVDVQCTIATLL